MPREKNPIWTYFHCKSKENNSGKWAVCKKCGLEMQGIPQRMNKHVQNCNNDKDTHTGRSSTQIQDTNEISEGQTNKSTPSPPGPDNLPAAKKKKTLPVPASLKIVRDCSFIATSSQYAHEINLQIAKYLYATNTPFAHADNPEFKSMCSMLRSGFKPPSSRKLADELLEEVYKNVMKDAKDRLENANLSMSLDGWSNVHNEPIVCCSVTSEYGESFLVKTIDTSGNAHTAEYLKRIAMEAIKETEEFFAAKVTSFVTDNTGNVMKMRRLLEEETPTNNIIQYGCSAHILHLLASDIQIPGLLEQIVKVIKYFRNTHLPAAWYKEAKGKRLITPQQVRWNTASDAIASYLENRGILVQLCQDKKELIDKDIFRIVNDIHITINAKDFLRRMKPIAVALDRMQRDGATIAVAVEIWKKLERLAWTTSKCV